MDTIKGMEAHLSWLRSEAARLKDELAEVENTIGAGTVFLQSLSKTAGINTSNGISPEDLKGCTTIHAAMLRYAELNGGTLPVSEFALALRQAGLTKSKNASAMVYRQLERHKRDWYKVKPGNYRLNAGKVVRLPNPSRPSAILDQLTRGLPLPPLDGSLDDMAGGNPFRKPF